MGEVGVREGDNEKDSYINHRVGTGVGDPVYRLWGITTKNSSSESSGNAVVPHHALVFVLQIMAVIKV